MNNNNNLYNILNNFNKLSESDTPKPATESKPKTLLESTMEEVLQEKYMGFKKTVGALKKQGGIEDPEALAASIGRKKYGKKAFQKAAAAGKKMGEEVTPPKTYGGQGPEGQKFDIYMQNRKDALDKQRPAPVPVVKPMGEGDMEEGNEFSGNRDKAIKSGQDEFKVDGKTYPVKENGLQRHIGIKKYTKKGFEELQAAGREGADEEEKGRIKDRYIKKVKENRDAYQRDYDSSVSGMGTDHEFRNRERNAGLEDEKNNYAVYIDGRQWKVFADRRQAENIARSLTNKGKKAEVYVTGANVSEESDWSNLGAEYRSTKPGTKEPTHTGEKEYFKGGVKHTKDYDREVSHTAATGEKRGRGRPKKSQFEGHYTIDQLIAEAFGEEDQEQSLNYEQDQLRNAIGDDLFAELQRSVSNGDYDFGDDLFQTLYDHYFDEMPPGTRKARDGDPYEWIGDKIGEVFSDDSLKEGGWQDIDDRSAPPKGAKQEIKTIEPGSAIRVDPNYKDPTTTKAPTKSPSMMDKVTQSAGRTPPYMPEKPTKADNGMGRIVQGTWQADPKGTVKAPSGDPEGVKESNPQPGQDFTTTQGAQMKYNPTSGSWQQQAPVTPNDPYTSISTKSTMNTKDVNGKPTTDYTNTTTATDPATGKTQSMTTTDDDANEDIMMTNELAEMMRLAGMTESKKAKPDYLDFDKDGDKKEPMKQALKDKKVDESEEKADKDYDGDGKIESGKDEYLGSKIAAAKKAGKLKEGTCKSCHKDPCVCKEEKCMECGMYESKCKCDESMSEALNQMRRIAGLKECDMSPISGAAGDMQQQQGKMNISTNMSSDGNKSVTITADGDSALELMQMLKLAGMAAHGEVEVEVDEESESPTPSTDGTTSSPTPTPMPPTTGGEVEEAKDPRYHANTTPEEHVYPEQVLTRGGNGDVAGRNKQMHKDGYQFGDNPMAMKESMGLKFMKEYEGIKVKK